jgi:uncharacterized lipoprotein YajG
MKTLMIAAAAMLLAGCACKLTTEPRYETCPFAGIDGVDVRDCKAIENIHNIKKGSAKAVTIHGKTHYAACKQGTNRHTHNGKSYTSTCK